MLNLKTHILPFLIACVMLFSVTGCSEPSVSSEVSATDTIINEFKNLAIPFELMMVPVGPVFDEYLIDEKWELVEHTEDSIIVSVTGKLYDVKGEYAFFMSLDPNSAYGVEITSLVENGDVTDNFILDMTLTIVFRGYVAGLPEEQVIEMKENYSTYVKAIGHLEDPENNPITEEDLEAAIQKSIQDMEEADGKFNYDNSNENIPSDGKPSVSSEEIEPAAGIFGKEPRHQPLDFTDTDYIFPSRHRAITMSFMVQDDPFEFSNIGISTNDLKAGFTTMDEIQLDSDPFMESIYVYLNEWGEAAIDVTDDNGTVDIMGLQYSYDNWGGVQYTNDGYLIQVVAIDFDYDGNKEIVLGVSDIDKYNYFSLHTKDDVNGYVVSDRLVGEREIMVDANLGITFCSDSIDDWESFYVDNGKLAQPEYVAP